MVNISQSYHHEFGGLLFWKAVYLLAFIINQRRLLKKRILGSGKKKSKAEIVVNC